MDDIKLIQCIFLAVIVLGAVVFILDSCFEQPRRKKRIMKENKYILVKWPKSQALMEHPRFSKCILCIDSDEISYMCPEDLYNEIFKE